MKTWIGIGAVIGLALVIGLGSILYRNLSADFQTTGQGPVIVGELAQRGLAVATSQGCIACHTLNGSAGIGPTWYGMFGRTETLKDGSTIVVDEAYIRESILQPGAKVVAEFENIMLKYPLPEEDLAGLVEFTRQLSRPE